MHHLHHLYDIETVKPNSYQVLAHGVKLITQIYITNLNRLIIWIVTFCRHILLTHIAYIRFVTAIYQKFDCDFINKYIDVTPDKDILLELLHSLNCHE